MRRVVSIYEHETNLNAVHHPAALPLAALAPSTCPVSADLLAEASGMPSLSDGTPPGKSKQCPMEAFASILWQFD